MGKKLKRIAISGGGGQVAYNLLFRIADGEIFGKDHPIALHILEIPEMMDVLKGVMMELEDCAYPLLEEIKIGSDPYLIFKDVNLAVLVGAKPRGPNMERKELLQENGKIFALHGKALNDVASSDLFTLVVGNPCNTNCLIALHHAPRFSKNRFCAMTRLDQNRAHFQLAKKAHVPIRDIEHVTVWGNHSATLVPDFVHAKVSGTPLTEVITDRTWLEKEFLKVIQQRGKEIIAARGKSSGGSAMEAIVDSLRALFHPDVKEKVFSLGVISDGNPYGIKEDLVFSFPCSKIGEGEYKIVENLTLDPFLEEKIAVTERELLREKEMITDMLNEKDLE